LIYLFKWNLDNRLSGKVKWFNVKTRFGYVQCDYNNEDVYVNSVSIVRNNPGKYKASLADGETVEFDILKSKIIKSVIFYFI
jgi:cold shock CspA family protein